MRNIYTALVTPFYKGKIDYDSLKDLIDRQNASDVAGLVVLGTTAESTLLTDKEKLAVVKFVRANTNKKVIAGLCLQSTRQCTAWAKRLHEIGAEQLLVVTPYYLNCNNVGIVAHFEKIAKASNLPLILYNVPRRTAFDISVETVCEIAKRCDLVGVKECNDDAKKLDRYLKCGINVLCGNDTKIDKFAKFGCKSAISVTSNLCPNLTVYGTGNNTFDKFSKLCAISNPSVVKYALFCAGITKSYQVRLPLTPPSIPTKKLIRNFVEQHWEKLQ